MSEKIGRGSAVISPEDRKVALVTLADKMAEAALSGEVYYAVLVLNGPNGLTTEWVGCSLPETLGSLQLAATSLIKGAALGAGS